MVQVAADVLPGVVTFSQPQLRSRRCGVAPLIFLEQAELIKSTTLTAKRMILTFVFISLS